MPLLSPAMLHPNLGVSEPLVKVAAAVAVTLLIVSILLIRRRKSSRTAGFIFLTLSIALHAVLLWFLPSVLKRGGSMRADESADQAGVIDVALSTFDPDMNTDTDAAMVDQMSMPLPVAELAELLEPPTVDTESQPDAAPESSTDETPDPQATFDAIAETRSNPDVDRTPLPPAPPTMPPTQTPQELSVEDDLAMLTQWLETPPPTTNDPPTTTKDVTQTVDASEARLENEMASTAKPATPFDQSNRPDTVAAIPVAAGREATVFDRQISDFAARQGAAKDIALATTGGTAETEAAVEAALRFLAQHQKANGLWDPAASGAGRDRAPLGVSRPRAGLKADTGISGLAMLAMMGSGHTHRDGIFADNLYRGLAQLIAIQKPDGSLAHDASVYASTYCHGMAALAMCEAAAMTGDPAAKDAAARALDFTTSSQHPTSGGWRYVAGDVGDLSQLGWQAMVIDAAHRADLPVDPRSVHGVTRFLDSVARGRHRGLACYRHGEMPTRSMTAEALATRLLLGLPVTDDQQREAATFLLAETPGTAADNYYYWYYATIALHQLQDENWQRWNTALQRRLLQTQRPDGSWPADSMWGGYGGTVYTTAMATLCLETYYRHVVRPRDKVAYQDPVTNLRR